MNNLEFIIAIILVIGILLLFFFLFKRDYNTKVLRNDIRAGKIDMSVCFFINEVRHTGVVYNYNRENDTVNIQYGFKTRIEPLHNIYSL